MQPQTCRKHDVLMRHDRNGVYHCPTCRRNFNRRAVDSLLRDLCGTSARAARKDMGLGCRYR